MFTTVSEKFEESANGNISLLLELSDSHVGPYECIPRVVLQSRSCKVSSEQVDISLIADFFFRTIT